MKSFCLFCAALLLLIFTACSRQTAKPETVLIPESVNEPQASVCIFFGNGFNDAQFIEEARHDIQKECGVQNGIQQLIFPTDFSGGRTGRISLLPDMIDSENVKALILLGAPEGTHRALAEIRETRKALQIFSLFPQDDVLGQSAWSNFVLEFAAPTANSTEEAEQVGAETKHLISLLPPLVKYVNSRAALPSETDALQKTLLQLFASMWNVHFYTDPETGIRAANCFIAEPKKS